MLPQLAAGALIHCLMQRRVHCRYTGRFSVCLQSVHLQYLQCGRPALLVYCRLNLLMLLSKAQMVQRWASGHCEHSIVSSGLLERISPPFQSHTAPGSTSASGLTKEFVRVILKARRYAALVARTDLPTERAQPCPSLSGTEDIVAPQLLRRFQSALSNANQPPSMYSSYSDFQAPIQE